MIHEVIVTTINKDKKVHIAPMGVKILQSDSKKLVQISFQSFLGLKLIENSYKVR